MWHCSRKILKLKYNVRNHNYFRNYSRQISNQTRASYWHTRGGFTFSNATLGDVVDTAADKYGDSVAISVPFQNINKTFTQFKQEVDQLAAGLIGLGFQKNDRIAIWSPNNYEWILSKFAVLKAGLILVCLNPAYRAAELQHTLNKVQCKAIIMTKTFKSENLYDIICEAVPEIPNSDPSQIRSQEVRSLQNIITFTNESLPGTYKLKDIQENDGSENRKIFHQTRKIIQFDDPCTIMFTSGTTGSPKAATSSHFQLVNSSIAFARKMGVDTEHVVLCLQVPLFHAFGYSVGPLMTLQLGGKCVVPSEVFHTPSSLKSIQNERCTLVYGVPTMYFDMLKHLSDSNYDLKSWKKGLFGASSVPEYLAQELERRLGIKLMNGYGSTEMNGVSVSNSPTDKYSGKPIEHVEVKIVGKDGNILPFNTKGEILCRSPYLFLGYWEDKDKTDEVLDTSKWYHSGDIGSMDEEGNICVTGRIKDLVIRGGENIYPQEIENLLIKHPAVSEAYVVGVPDTRMGEELCACIQLKPNQGIKEKDVKEFCKDKISKFKIPKYVVFVEEFPKTESGKIQKYKLQEQCAKLLK
ncbi:medium-chain acyl-CoA ligase ACSF2, mitochondrial-like [Centruroides vittatus]|uniref:medium-chain acyl-CoA ligase ACSF2, mitochondrial-like n=1 Tax=Centruroides vittatus TaxID=120091 RepID=UPI00350F7487